MLVRLLAFRPALLMALSLMLSASPSSADIYQWTLAIPSDPSQGVVQSPTLCPCGSGVNAAPGANLASLDLTQAYLVNANLTNANLSAGTLAYADISGGTLTNANFTGAMVTGTDFGSTNLTSSQLYSTASYQAQNLQGVGLKGNDLTLWSFIEQILTNANLAGTNLTGATFYGASLTGADFTGATVIAANFGSTNLTGSQLYSTAGYQSHDLRRIGLQNNNLSNWNLAGQNLSGATLYSSVLTNANLACANLTYANLFGATLTGANLNNANLQQAELILASLSGANLSGADLRGSIYFDGAGAIQANMIGPDGTIQGLNLGPANPLLIVRNSSMPIQIAGGATIAGGGTLQAIFDGPNWGSTISFAASSSVALGGDLDLEVASGVSLASLLGQNLQLFHWTGVSPSGQFSQITSQLPAGYSWNTSALYTTGIIDLTQTAIGPVNGQWAANGGGTWSSTANWTGGNVPGEPQDTALFGTVLTAGTAVVNLDTHVNLASLAFSTTGGASYMISSTSGNSLILSSTSGPASITDSGSNTIAAPITFESNLSVSATTDSVLTIAGAISDSGSHSSLTFSGGGTLILSPGAPGNSYSGGTIVESGRVVVTNSAALADGSSLTIGDPAAFAAVVPASSSAASLNETACLAPVPEPSAMAFTAVAVAGVIAYRLRRQAKR